MEYTRFSAINFISPQWSKSQKSEARSEEERSRLQDVVRVVFKPGTTLKQSLVKTKFNPTKCTSRSLETCNLCQQYGRYKYKDCETKSVVYLLECSLCSEIYVGETARPFRERTREHHLSIRNKEDKAFGLHYKVSHKGQAVPSLPFKASLLRSCKDEPDRKLWEAEYIKYKSPSINTQLIKCCPDARERAGPVFPPPPHSPTNFKWRPSYTRRCSLILQKTSARRYAWYVLTNKDRVPAQFLLNQATLH